MVSSGMLFRVALVSTHGQAERGATLIKATRMGELGTTRSVRRLLLRANVVPSSQFLSP
jgi:hypothetical protein